MEGRGRDCLYGQGFESPRLHQSNPHTMKAREIRGLFAVCILRGGGRRDLVKRLYCYCQRKLPAKMKDFILRKFLITGKQLKLSKETIDSQNGYISRGCWKMLRLAESTNIGRWILHRTNSIIANASGYKF